jgi:hypothetical protein
MSYNSGWSWALKTSSTIQFRNISCSYDGKIIIANGYNNIAISIDSGNNWNINSTLLLDFNGVACTPDGKKLLVTAYNSICYILTGTSITGDIGSILQQV